MKGHRFITSLYFVVMLVAVPLLFLLLNATMQNFFAEVTWEDAVVSWMNQQFNLPAELSPNDADNLGQRILAGGARKWLVDLSTLPFLAWLARFLSGSLEEIRYTHHLSSLKGIEIISRWLAVAVMLLLCSQSLAATFYRILRFFQIWEPLVLLFAFSLFIFLCFWCWQYPDRRLKHVEKIYHFEGLKR